MEEMMSLEGGERELKQLARHFPNAPVRVEKGEPHYLLLLDSEGPRQASEVLATGVKALDLTWETRDYRF